MADGGMTLEKEDEAEWAHERGDRDPEPEPEPLAEQRPVPPGPAPAAAGLPVSSSRTRRRSIWLSRIRAAASARATLSWSRRVGRSATAGAEEEAAEGVEEADLGAPAAARSSSSWACWCRIRRSSRFYMPGTVST